MSGIEKHPPTVRDPQSGMGCGLDYQALYEQAKARVLELEGERDESRSDVATLLAERRMLAVRAEKAEAELTNLRATPVGALRDVMRPLLRAAEQAIAWIDDDEDYRPFRAAIDAADRVIAATKTAERPAYPLPTDPGDERIVDALIAAKTETKPMGVRRVFVGVVAPWDKFGHSCIEDGIHIRDANDWVGGLVGKRVELTVRVLPEEDRVK